jgi:hypothetical protein
MRRTGLEEHSGVAELPEKAIPSLRSHTSIVI